MSKQNASSAILVVDDDSATRTALKRALLLEGYSVVVCDSAPGAIQRIKESDFHLVVTDVVMEGMTGIDLLEHLQKDKPELPVVVCTGYGTIESAVDAIQKGATDYLTKPINLEALAMTVKQALATSALKADNRSLREQLLERHSFEDVIGRAPQMVAVFDQVRAIAPVDVTVLLRGESGTGKGVIARAIHRTSSRSSLDMVTVDCAAIAPSLVESELFGHERGAFTGAIRRQVGKIEAANGSTLFLDEIGDLPLMLQTKLLRVLQDQTFERIGSTKPISADVRIIAATNRSLEEMIEEGTFRSDLYYRLNVVGVELPPLRERREDIELLARQFLSEFSEMHQLRSVVLHRSARDVLLAYRWPGNVRELRNLCQNLVVTSRDDVISAAHLPAHLTTPASVPSASEEGLLDGSHKLAEIDRHAVFQTLARTGGNKNEAARILGIGLKTLYRRLEEYGAEDSSSQD